MRSCAMDGVLTLQKGALRARSAERNILKEQGREERERETERKTERKKERKKERTNERKKERKKDSRASPRALVCFGRRALRALKYAPERRAHCALCRQKDRERET